MSLKNFLNCVINRVRVLTIVTALVIHTQKLCWLGLCPEEKPVETTVGSVIFALSLGLLLAEYDLVPEKINCPSTTAYYVVMVAGTILLTNLAFRLIWLPLCDPLVVDFLNLLAVIISLIQDLIGVCTKLPEILTDETTHSVLTALIALVILFWVADGVGIVDCAKENIVIKLPWKRESRRSGGSGGRRVSFSHCPRLKTGHSRRRRYSRCPTRHDSSHALYSTDDEAVASHSELTHGSSDTTPSTLNSPRILKEFVNDTHIMPPS